MTAPDRSQPGEHLREHRVAGTIWITTPAYEALGPAAGLLDPAAAERWLALAASPDRAPSSNAPGRAQTRIETLPGSEDRVHVRRLLHGGWLAPLWRGRIAGPARLREELRVTVRLSDAGAPVAPAAFGVARRDGLLWRAALCTVHIEGAIDAITFLRTMPARDAVAEAAHAAGLAVRRVHDLGLRHADLHLGNILIRKEPSTYRAWVIDFDRARLTGAVDARRRRRELARLERSLKKRQLVGALGREGVRAFCSGYRGEAAEPTRV